MSCDVILGFLHTHANLYDKNEQVDTTASFNTEMIEDHVQFLIRIAVHTTTTKKICVGWFHQWGEVIEASRVNLRRAGMAFVEAINLGQQLRELC